MRKDRVKELIPVLQAFVSGGRLQVQNSRGNWQDISASSEIFPEHYRYRIKPINISFDDDIPTAKAKEHVKKRRSALYVPTLTASPNFDIPSDV